MSYGGDLAYSWNVAPWTVALWGRNIFDKSFDITRNFFLPSSEVAAAGEPTTVGIRVSYKY